MLAMPGFLFVSSNIYECLNEWSRQQHSPTIVITIPDVILNILSNLEVITFKYSSQILNQRTMSVSVWVILATNVVTQLICITGVYSLTQASDSLTTTLVITLRKFISIMLSVMYFNHSFSTGQYVGTILVFLGIAIYSFPSSSGSSNKVTSASSNHHNNKSSDSLQTGSDATKGLSSSFSSSSSSSSSA
jgi:uncharacterized membrane protein